MPNVTLSSSDVPTYPDVFVGPVSLLAHRVVKTKAFSRKKIEFQ